MSLKRLMVHLLPVQVTQTYPFENVSIDLGGPKVYIIVYVCLVTKVAHLDLVTDFTVGSRAKKASQRAHPLRKRRWKTVKAAPQVVSAPTRSHLNPSRLLSFGTWED